MFSSFLKFNNEISIADILSLSATIISFITLIFLFVQRKDASKTRVFLDNHSDNTYIKINANEPDFSNVKISLGIVGGEYISNFKLESHLINGNDRIENVYTSHSGNRLYIIHPTIQYDYVDKNNNYSLNEHFIAYVFAMGDYMFSQLKDNSDAQQKLANLKSYVLYTRFSYCDSNGYAYKSYYKIFADLVAIEYKEMPSMTYRIIFKKIDNKTYKKGISFKKAKTHQ